MANWFKQAMSDMGDTLKDTFNDVTSSPEKAMFAAASPLLKGNQMLFQTGQKAFKDYQYRNGGKTAENELAKAQTEAELEAGQVKAKQVSTETTSAAARYGGSDAFSSLTNQSIMSPNKKKSILGGF